MYVDDLVGGTTTTETAMELKGITTKNIRRRHFSTSQMAVKLKGAGNLVLRKGSRGKQRIFNYKH